MYEYFSGNSVCNDAPRHAPLLLQNTLFCVSCSLFSLFIIFRFDFFLLSYCYFSFEIFPFCSSFCCSISECTFLHWYFLHLFFFFTKKMQTMFWMQKEEEEKTIYPQFSSHQLPIRYVLVIFKMNLFSNSLPFLMLKYLKKKLCEQSPSNREKKYINGM